MATVQINIPDEILEKLQPILGDDVTSDFVAASFQEWMNWLDGSHRVTSITELETERIYTIYGQILKKSIPSANAIGQIFSLPLGKSQYIVRNLKYKHPHFFQERKCALILQSLKSAKREDNNRTFIIEVDIGCQDTLDRVINSLIANHKLRSKPSVAIDFDIARYELGQGHYEALMAEFKGV